MPLCRRGSIIWRGAVVALLALHGPFPSPSNADTTDPGLHISASHASSWSEGPKQFVLLEDHVAIRADNTHLTSDRAVVTLTPIAGDAEGRQSAHIALLGNARAEQPDLTRSASAMNVTLLIAGQAEIVAESLKNEDRSDSSDFQKALQLASAAQVPQADTFNEDDRPPAAPALGEPLSEAGSPQDAAPARMAPVQGDFGRARTTRTEDGTIALILQNNFMLSQQRENGDLLQLQAERGVVFTTLQSLSADDLAGAGNLSDAVVGAYLEGDVTITFTPAAEGLRSAEQKLQANRVYYDFLTDRAVLTQAVFSTVDLQRGMPIILRADVIRQLSKTDRITEYSADKATLTTSAFAVPSLSIGMSKVYVRQRDTGSERFGTLTSFAATHARFQAFDVPFFYLPVVGGAMTERGFPLRSIGIGNSKHFGTSLETTWGLFETLGVLPPADLDAEFRLDYYSDRGPAAGLDAEYGGGFITDTTREPWNFTGDFTSYFVEDSGSDNLGRERARIGHDQEWRGRVAWEHQHFFPDDWQVQFRANYVSDATFLEEWFEREYDSELPAETSAYFKRQQNTEALTFLATIQPNDVITSAEFAQEQFEIERIPEIGYHRIGDSLADDQLTFFSSNTVGGLRFNNDGAQEIIPGAGVRNDQGYRPENLALDRELTDPGLPAVGTTGVEGDTVYRGDFRQEVGMPFSLGQVRALPYVLGRVTAYSDTPEGSAEERLFAGTGVRFNTSFWRVFDGAESRLLDVHRVRHVVEPELHLFASAQSTDRDELFIYDEQIDKINDISGAQLALRQRWQTKRGDFDRRRSVDFLVFNVDANFFANEPSDDEDPADNVIPPPDDRLDPINFRGVFFPSLPETSIARDSVNADALWRVSDTFVVLADAQHNLSENQLATAAAGFAAQRGDRLSYYVGMRYIEELNSAIGTIAASYEITRKYSLMINQSYDFGSDDGTVYSSLGLTRKFDRFFMNISVYNNSREGDSGIRFNLYPQGIGYGLASDSLGGLFTQ